MSSTDTAAGAIAIVGMAGRFPGARTLEEFWDLVRSGGEAVSRFAEPDLQPAWYDVTPGCEEARAQWVKARAVLDEAEWFDAAFFGVSPRDAELMDPQHRIFLECAWEALENAGYASNPGAGVTGVFAGAGMNSYLLANLVAGRHAAPWNGGLALLVAGEKDHLPTRVSYKLNLRGPSLNVQTACSTSLAAVALACQSLQAYQCDTALAGGVSVSFPQRRAQLYQEGAILSADGHCRPFDASASGTVSGDGAAVLVLRRLADAVADGDFVHAVIRGWGMNNDGAQKAGYAAPSVDGQAEVIASALAHAGVRPESVSYVEAHGTATPLGDPIEFAGLCKAFGGAAGNPWCALGSVKANVGHLDAAAGAAGLVKTVLALRRGELPPSAYFRKPNPNIDLARSPFYLPTEPKPWIRGAAPRRAGVSSFGIGGTNVHVVLEEAPAAESAPAALPMHVLTCSAKSATALAASLERLAAWLDESGSEQSLADVAYTLQVGRKAFAFRQHVIAANPAEAAKRLRAAARAGGAAAPASERTLLLFFPDSGAVPVEVARVLCDQAPAFRNTVEHCGRALGFRLPRDGWSWLETSARGEKGSPSHAAALFAFEYALARLLRRWGLSPGAVSGEGVGACVAACVAGALSLEDALALASLPPFVAGSQDAEDRIAAHWRKALGRVTPHAPKLPWISSATGETLPGSSAAELAHWRHARRRGSTEPGRPDNVFRHWGCRFVAGPADGSENSLVSAAHEGVIVPFSANGDPGGGLASLLDSLGRLWRAGVPVNWRALHAGERRRRVPLPSYPFERRKFWIEPGHDWAAGPAGQASSPEGAAGAELTSALLRRLAGEVSGFDLMAAPDTASFVELGFDSLLLAQTSQVLEECFHVAVPFRMLQQEITTLGQLAAYLEVKGSRMAPAAAAPGDREREGDSPADATRVVPLTEEQREIWLATRLSPAISAAYNESCVLRLSGELDVPAFQEAVRQLVARHDALRISFERGGERQRVAAQADATVAVRDVSGPRNRRGGGEAERVLDGLLRTDFDLERGPLWRMELLRLSRNEHLFVLVVHHLVCDGWSLGVILYELGELYSAARAHRDAGLGPARSYADHALAGVDGEKSAGRLADEEYWMKQYAGSAPTLELPADRPRPEARTFEATRRNLEIPPALASAIRNTGARHGCTEFTVLLAAFNLLLHRLSGQDDLAVGVPVAAQVMRRQENLVGHCANLLPIRSRLRDGETFAEFLADTRVALLEGLEHWRQPFSHLVRRLDLPRDPNRVPLTNVVFNATRLRGTPRFEGVEVRLEGNPKSFLNFDLSLNFSASDKAIVFGCDYSTELFDEATIVRWLEGYRRLLESAVADPSGVAVALAFDSPAERSLVVREWNATDRPFPSEKTVQRLFTERAAEKPGAVALVHGGTEITFAALDAESSRIARRLHAAGIGPGDIVGVFLERSPLLVSAILGVLKAGGAYLPLDPAYPRERLSFIVEDSGLPLLLTQGSLAPRLPAPGPAKVLRLDDAAAQARGSETPGSPAVADEGPEAAGRIAYVIYTSGSTGKPKGVAIEHRNLMALLAWARGLYSDDELGGVLCATSVCFDLSVFEIFAPLCLGGTAILAENVFQVPDLPCADRIRLVNTVPSVMAELLHLGCLPQSVVTVNLAGEALSQGLVEELYRLPHVRNVYDLYGPTEATVYATCSRRSAGGASTIGRPLPNVRAYVLDRWRQPVAPGIRGELVLGGAGIGRGYLNRPDLTRERFIGSPFVPGERLYLTGDLARFRPDGEIEFLGRGDDQVKLRGYRIELGEVETALRAHASVRDCLVVVREISPGDPRLVAYVAGEAGAEGDPSSLRRHLLGCLPDYMVPSLFVFLDALPRSPNGKLNRRALPAPPSGTAPRAAAGPARSSLEAAVADIWREVLGTPSIGVDDNFFSLGGHSLLAARVLVRIRESLGVELPLGKLFATPTVAELARLVEEALEEEAGAPPFAAKAAVVSSGAIES